MSVYAGLQWNTFRKTYYANFFIFFMFLIVFNLHAFNYVNLVQCDVKTDTCPQLKCHKNAWRRNNSMNGNEYDILDLVLNCYENSTMISIHNVSKVCLIILLISLSLWEFLQFLSRLYACKIWHYFNKQNLVEIFIYALTSALLCHENDKEIAGHLFGWSLLLTWLNFTLFLSSINMIGKRLFMSFYVMKEVALTLLTYVPTIFGFASAFHCFLYGSPDFQHIMASILQTMVMLLGEVPLQNFQDSEVHKVGGRNISAQVKVYFFERARFL